MRDGAREPCAEAATADFPLRTRRDREPPHTGRMTKAATLESQLALWAVQETERVKMRDDFTVVRPVEHFAYFWRRVFAEAAAAQLRDRGFDATVGRRRFTTILLATRSESLSHASVERFLREVVSIVERAHGDYDGWGASLEAFA